MAKARAERTASWKRPGHVRHLKKLNLASKAEYRAWCEANKLGDALSKSWRRRRAERRLALRQSAERKAEQTLASRATDLAMASAEEYQEWRRENGLSEGVWISPERANAERDLQRRRKSEVVLAESVARLERPMIAIAAIFDGRVTPEVRSDARYRPIIAMVRTMPVAGKVREAYRSLLILCATQTRMFRAGVRACDPFGDVAENTFPAALALLAKTVRDWQRPLDEWRAPNVSAYRQFRSLVHHLLCRYPTPEFLTSAWFDPVTARGVDGRKWQLALGDGAAARELPLPVEMTHKQRHAFLHAPADLNAFEALRWGQIIGSGGGPGTARMLISTRLRHILEDEPFWNEVLLFLIQRQVSKQHLHLLIDYLHARRFERRLRLVGIDGLETLQAPEPEFSLKGRTVANLVQLAATWRQQEILRSMNVYREWQAMPHTESWEAVSEDDVRWIITELLNTHELVAEGDAQHNCVATYYRNCLVGDSAILSVRLLKPETKTWKRILTVETCPSTKSVVQVRGTCNWFPCEETATDEQKQALALLKQWAKANGYAISKHTI